MAFRLLDHATPLEPVEFPNGREFAIRPLGPEEWEMLREVQRTSDGAKALELLARVVPDASAEDVASLGIEDVATLLTYAARQITKVLDNLKNSAGGAAATPTPPSNPPATPSPS